MFIKNLIIYYLIPLLITTLFFEKRGDGKNPHEHRKLPGIVGLLPTKNPLLLKKSRIHWIELILGMPGR